MPSTALEGITTASGWKIGKMINKTSGTGGNFCTRYTASYKDEKIGFLKAMDLSRVMSSGNLEDINRISSEYLFEQRILEKCKDKKLTRVVTPLDSGEVTSPSGIGPYRTVYYIIFELAECDLREQFLNDINHDSWLSVFKSLHHVAVGIRQLHKIGVAHQDIKPSNVLLFESNNSKISDLGRVTDDKNESPFSDYSYTGDPAYAPIEMKFGVNINEFIDRRASDLYMFGSLIYHVIEGVQISPILINESNLLMPNFQISSYYEALPFMKSAFTTIINRFSDKCQNKFDEEIANELVSIVNELCNPDYQFRGNKKHSSKIMRLSMEKYVGKMASVVRKIRIKGFR